MHKQDLTTLRRPTCDLNYLTLAIKRVCRLPVAKAPSLLTAGAAGLRRALPQTPTLMILERRKGSRNSEAKPQFGHRE